MKQNILKAAALNAVGTTLYVAAVASFLFYAPHFDRVPNVLIPIGMLLLFVCSAAITGMFVVGKPVMWYLDGKKKDATALLFSTVAFLFAISVLLFSLLIVLTK